MAQRAPGQSHRTGITLPALFATFPDDATGERWFVETRWPTGSAACPRCGSLNVLSGAKHKTMPHRCRDCRKRFSVRTGTAMEGSNLGFQTWAIAITQKSAWHLAHRLREAWNQHRTPTYNGPVEVDETYIGGRGHNKHASKKLRAGRGPVGKTPAAGVKDRATGQVSAAVVPATDGATLVPFVTERTAEHATVYTDDHGAYFRLPRAHETVRHSVGEYVDGQAHTNGVESFWSLLKRGYHGTYHQMSVNHRPDRRPALTALWLRSDDESYPRRDGGGLLPPAVCCGARTPCFTPPGVSNGRSRWRGPGDS